MNPLNHVAIIMDGNGRWGVKNKNSRNLGHKEGLFAVEKIIKQTIERDNGDHHGDHHPTGRRVRDPPRRFEKENHVLVRSGETHREGRTRATV